MTTETSKKHKWSTFDNIMVTLGYLIGISPYYIGNMLNYIPLESIEMKYKNCLYLEQGNVDGALKHVSKEHKKVWYLLNHYILIVGDLLVIAGILLIITLFY